MGVKIWKVVSSQLEFWTTIQIQRLDVLFEDKHLPIFLGSLMLTTVVEGFVAGNQSRYPPPSISKHVLKEGQEVKLRNSKKLFLFFFDHVSGIFVASLYYTRAFVSKS